MHMANFCAISFDDNGVYRPERLRILGQSAMRNSGFLIITCMTNDEGYKNALKFLMEGVDRTSDTEMKEFVAFVIGNYKHGERMFYCNCPGSGSMFGDIGDAKYPAVEIVTCVLESFVKRGGKFTDLSSETISRIFRESDYDVYKLYLTFGFDPILYPFEALYLPQTIEILTHNLSLGLDSNVCDSEGVTVLARRCKELENYTWTGPILVILKSGARTTEVDSEGRDVYHYLSLVKAPYASCGEGPVSEVRKMLWSVKV